MVTEIHNGDFVGIETEYLTHVPINIDFFHHQIHRGGAFVVTDVDASVDIASPKYWRITTPASNYAHFEVFIWADAPGLAEVFENPTEDDPVVAGTALTAYNRNRNSSKNASINFKYDPVFAADGTKINHARIGTAAVIPILSAGGQTGSRKEIILKTNEDYVVKFTPDGDGTACWIQFDWYEL